MDFTYLSHRHPFPDLVHCRRSKLGYRTDLGPVRHIEIHSPVGY